MKASAFVSMQKMARSSFVRSKRVLLGPEMETCFSLDVSQRFSLEQSFSNDIHVGQQETIMAQCSSCGGLGRVPCSNCGGRGKRGTVICYHCGGTGRTICYKCGGSGTVEPSRCEVLREQRRPSVLGIVFHNRARLPPAYRCKAQLTGGRFVRRFQLECSCAANFGIEQRIALSTTDNISLSLGGTLTQKSPSQIFCRW